MPYTDLSDIQDYIFEVRARAEKSQADAHKNLNPLFAGRDRVCHCRLIPCKDLILHPFGAQSGWPSGPIKPQLNHVPAQHSQGTNSSVVAFYSHGQKNAPGTAMTRKDFQMEWDQIENKWAAMTRRIRADWSDNQAQGIGTAARRTPRLVALPPLGPDQKTAARSVDASLKMSVE